MLMCVQIMKRIERCCAQVHRGINLKVCGVCVRLNDGGCEGREVKEEDGVCVCVHALKQGIFLSE